MDCYYHPKNALFNFCMNPGCALPLCPKCINIHLSQSQNSHQIISLNDAVSLVTQQLDTACQGLVHQLKLLKEDLSPNNVMSDYEGMIQKYRQQALDEINRHYDYLEKQLLSEINSKYSHHLQSLVTPIEDQLGNLDKARNGIKQRQKQLESLIVVVSRQSIANAEELLLTIQERKRNFKNQLPRLKDGDGGRLKLASHKIDPVSQRYVLPTFNPLPPQKSYIEPYPLISADSLSGIDRIAQLEARLHTLRYV